jgi:hypothetical protein
MTAPTDLRELRFRRDVERLHRLGPRALHALLAELGARRLIRAEVEALVANYVARLDDEMVRAAGGDRFPPRPVYLVRRR